MKKSFTIYALIAFLFVLQSCSEIEHPISGSRYRADYYDAAVYIKFCENGKFEHDYMTKTLSGWKHDETEHLKWKYDNTGVYIYHDNSLYWKSSVRGKRLWDVEFIDGNNIIKINGVEYEKL